MKRQPKPPGAWAKFRLLMWKNYLQQWRQRWQTMLELLIPVVTMTLVLILRWQIHPSHKDTFTFPPVRVNSVQLSIPILVCMNTSQMSIAYSPRSEVLDNVVRSSIAKLILQNLDLIPIVIDEIKNTTSGDGNISYAQAIDYLNLPCPITLPDNITLPEDITVPENMTLPEMVYTILRSLIQVTPYDKGSDLRGIYADEAATRKVLAAVEFDDDLFGATELPNDIQYALRYPERPRFNSFFGIGGRSWRTDNVFPIWETPGPRFPDSWEGGNDPGYFQETFIALQHMISTELISRFTGVDLSSFRFMINRYPHPAFIQDYAVEILRFLFSMFVMLSFSFTAVNSVRAITVEKEMQLKETMKIMGLPTWLHWTAWFWKQITYLTLVAILIVVIVKVNWFTAEDGFTDFAVFTSTPWHVLFFFIMLYMTCMITFCFMISCFFSKAGTAAMLSGLLWFLTYIPAFLLAMDIDMTFAVQILVSLSINSAMAFGFQLLFNKENSGGMQWGDFFDAHSADSSRILFGHVVIMLVVDSVLYLLIALYLEQVFPGPFGTPRRWYFFVQKSFWFTYKNDDELEEEIDEIDGAVKDHEPTGHNIGVKMNNLTKVFGPNIAVNNMSLNIYDDQITVLLGHNGAGKSTTISMLTGNLEITRGSVVLAGYDVTNQSSAARTHVGLCPQHNVLFGELTVHEHLEFFSRLKGFYGKEMRQEINTLITKLELEEKRTYQSSGLSGGQKRRLQVGIALCGAASVVLLDEPTSGMDPASRRALWDLLQKEKEGRSIILTTHFMDEADILGDRVAIMANGRLKCLGSPFFLKKHYGVGYTLVIVKKEGFDIDACTALLNKHIPDTVVKDDSGTEVTYNLTNDYSYAFEPLLNELEENIDTIGFLNYGLDSTTLEDVFMSVGSDVRVSSGDSDTGTTITTVTTTENNADDFSNDYDSSAQLNELKPKITGFRLLLNHVLAIWLKLWLVWSRTWLVLILQILVPILQMNITLGIMVYIRSFEESIQERLLSLTEGYHHTETLLNFNGSSLLSLGGIATKAYEEIFVSAGLPTMGITVVDEPIDEHYLNRTADPLYMGFLRNRLLTGATFDDDGATIWFSNFGFHDIATSLASVHAAIFRALSPNANISVINHPLEANYANQDNIQAWVQSSATQVSNGIGNSIGIMSAAYIMFYIKERVSRAKLLQKASGITPAVMWFTAAIFDWLWFLIACVTIVISCVAFQVIGLSTFTELGRMYVILMVYGAAMLPLNYLGSFFFKGAGTGFGVIFFLNILFGLMGSQIVDALAQPFLDTAEAAKILDYILQFFPLYSGITAINTLIRTELTVFSCLQGCDFLQAVNPDFECSMEILCNNFSTVCCVRENPHWDWESPGVMRYVVCMIGTMIFLWTVLMVIEYRLPQKIFNRQRKPPPLDESTLDNDVVDEIRHVERIGNAVGEHSLIARNLSKYYGKHLAVDQISFTVSDTECFGLLGVNGAGKTSTFKMLMGDESISFGDAYVGRNSVKTDIIKVHENIGYCPQFDAIFNEFTGRETLRFFSMLRGLPSNNIKEQTETLANALGFFKHIDKKVSQYSGGNKRKLSTAVALLGRTRLLFVDEPTTGVDPAAKRQVWSALKGYRRSGRGVVLTSHSMEECEALCSRLTIMVNGRFQCLGTPQHLKNKFSQGFTLTIKMKVNEDITASNLATQAIKEYVSSKFFEPKIMEEYQGLITYYLTDTNVPWSRMFGIMEYAKRELNVEDYNISQTTLEQIFLQFTKYQQMAKTKSS